MTKLIIVEGLPGSGKTTTAKIIFNMLNNNGINVELFCEGNDEHPADYEGVAYFGYKEFDKLNQKHSLDSVVLDRIKIEIQDGILIPYLKELINKKLSINEELLDDIVEKDIYELPLEVHCELIERRWMEFVNSYKDEEKVVIFECCFIQNPTTITMIRDGCSKEVTKNYIKRLESIIEPLNPLLIYVEQEAISTSFKKAIEERPIEWIKGFTKYYTEQGFGLKNNLVGIEGVLVVLEKRRELEKEIYKMLKIKKEIVDNTQFTQKTLESSIGKILQANY